jgi:hypothetical protein
MMAAEITEGNASYINFEISKKNTENSHVLLLVLLANKVVS